MRYSPLKTCPHCGKKFRANNQHQKYCSLKCYYSIAGGNSTISKKRSSGRRTDIEKIVESFLIQNSIIYCFEHQIGLYSIDFAIPSMMIAIECDGDYWHSLPKRKRSDSKRDLFLKDSGWTVIRLPGKQIVSGEFRDTLLSVLLA
jgi:very-short-patch-repair endonuclease